MSVLRHRTRTITAGVVFVSVLVGAGAYVAHRQEQSPTGGAAAARTTPPVPVRAANVELRPMPVRLSQIGTVDAMATVAVRSRIDGQIVEVGFSEGDYVRAGQVLFRLDDRTARAQLAEAEANLLRDRAQLADAKRTLARSEALAERGFTSRATLDTAQMTVSSLQAAAAAATAQIDNLKTLLDYTVIRAPIEGRTGTLAFKLGATIRENDAALVTINQTRPISVVFSAPQAELGAIRRAQARGALPVNVHVRGAGMPPAVGTLAFIDNAVNAETGTILLKASLPNADERLWPGQFVDVDLLVETRPDVAVVPETAVRVGQNGPVAFVIRPDQTIELRPVEIARADARPSEDGQTFVLDGLRPGERVVTDGHLRLAPGATVSVVDPASPPASGGPGS